MAGVEEGLLVPFYLYPCGLFATLFSSQVIRYRRTPKADKVNVEDAEKIRRFYNSLIRLFQAILTPLLAATIAIAAYHAIIGNNEETNFPYSAYLASHIGVLLYFLIGILPDPDGPWSATASHCHAWIVGALLEAVIAAVFMSQEDVIKVPPKLLQSLLGLSLARIVVLLFMIALLKRRQHDMKSIEPERQPLLESGDGPTNGYGGTNAPHINGQKSEAKKAAAPENSGWLAYLAGFRVLFPYLWPKNSPLHQATVIFCVVILVGQRIVNILVPRQLGELVSALGYGRVPYTEMILYVVYRFLQGNGVLGAARSILWIPVSQSLYRRLTCAAFEHVLGLSLDFHLSKRIGEVTSALSRGSSMNSFLENFVFQVFPMVFDIFVAAVYFFVQYDAFYTLIILLIMWSYIFLTMYMAQWRAKQRRDMVTKARDMDAVKTDAIMAYETVQHNCAVSMESEKYTGHVWTYQRAERMVQLSLNLLNFTQSTVFTFGTALIVGVSAYKISIGQQTVPEFITLITYFTQLQAPLNFFGTYYTFLQNSLIDAERMLDLFKETSGIIDKPDADDLPSPQGEVAFNEVEFFYQHNKPAIDGVSFSVRPGTKTALVGESGSGKSTCLRLLFRFYDVKSGSVTVDGHDIRDLKLDSLRKAIGVVPQDTVLFNNTIMYNIQYAKPDATEEEVFEACRAANIHDRILAFPDGYETKVGERGLKLSGGERQRVAIARAILKDASILLLDEATASLDSHTERLIQDALERVTKGRTTITIAHRLSTITTSDQILVLHKGKVVEHGTHAELIELDGRYHAMWEKQTTANKEAMETGEKLIDKDVGTSE